jgi:hypothetical protein
MADDYLQIQLGREYGPVQAWSSLMHDPLYRCRATSLVLTYWTERFAGLDPFAFNLTSLSLHMANTLLLFALGSWAVIGWKRSFASAGFFAVAEGHQEAVMWDAAVPELLVYFFVIAAAGAFVRCVTGAMWKWGWYAAALISFVLALASKESGVVAIGACLLVCAVERVPLRTCAALILPFVALGSVYVYAIFASSGAILHFHDGAFSLHAPVMATMLNSVVRLLWFWGIPAIIILLAFDRRTARVLLPLSICWIVISLVPYSFLTYMNRVPSRHTYMASAGLSLIAGAAFMVVMRIQNRRWIAALVAAIVVTHNVGYLWTRKHSQYERRSAPTEELLRVFRGNPAQVRILCFPYSRWIAQYTITVGAKQKWDDRMWQPRKDCQVEQTVIVRD